MSNTPLGQFITLYEAARLCRKSRKTIGRWVRYGVGGRRLQAWRVGGETMTTLDALAAFCPSVHADSLSDRASLSESAAEELRAGEKRLFRSTTEE